MAGEGSETERIVRYLRRQAATAVQNIRPADAREMEDVMLLQTVLNEAADAIDRGDHNGTA